MTFLGIEPRQTKMLPLCYRVFSWIVMKPLESYHKRVGQKGPPISQGLKMYVGSNRVKVMNIAVSQVAILAKWQLEFSYLLFLFNWHLNPSQNGGFDSL